MDRDRIVDAVRTSIVGPTKSWVLFEHGTFVVLVSPGSDLAAEATAVLSEWGPVHPGSPAGDFSVITLRNGLGWHVTSHHGDLLTFVARDEVAADADSLAIGLRGRSKRDRDARELRVIHVEDRRAAQPGGTERGPT